MNHPQDTSSSSGTAATGAEQARRLREQIAELKKNWPAHSVPPSLLQRLEDLEEELEKALRSPG